MADHILFPDTFQPSFDNLGRNGESYPKGIQVSTFGAEVHLEPINSRGDVTRCRIVVPRDQIPALIKMVDGVQ